MLMSIRIGDSVLNNGGTATFNGTSLTKIIYDGVTVWQKGIPIYVTMLNDLSGHLICSCMREDGTTLCTYTGTTPNFFCVRLKTCEPLSERTRIGLNMYCETTFCTSSVLPDGTQAYVNVSIPTCCYNWNSVYMEAGATCMDVCLDLPDKGWTFGPDKYTVCPEGAVLPEGACTRYILGLNNYSTGVNTATYWCCGCTKEIPVR